METSELLRYITALPVISAGLAEEMLTGNFRSVFKGQGMEFDEARHYQPGDDIRSIDWNASARFGTPWVKMYREERELTILLLIDISPSMFRSGYRADYAHRLTPYEQGLLAAALIALSAEHTDQQAGALFFDNGIEKIFPPRKGRRHIMSLIMTALKYKNKVSQDKNKNGSNIASALSGAQRLLKRRSLVVVISDFFSLNWEQEMTNLSRKHDVIALRICDPPELPWQGLVTIEDPETGVKIEAPAGTAYFRESWTAWQKERSEHWVSQCRRSGASYLELSTTADVPYSLLKFFGGVYNPTSVSRSRKRLRK